MNLRTFRASSMATALAQVKRQFGPDAVILNTRTANEGGVLGLGQRSYVEITAAPADDAVLHGRANRERRGRSERDDPRLVRPKRVPPGRLAAQPADSSLVAAELTELKSMVRRLVTESRRDRLQNRPDSIGEVYQALVANEVAEDIAQQLVDQVCHELTPENLRDTSVVRNRLAKAVASMLPAAGGIEIPGEGKQKIVALIGPTGVGKTTTIAKLAAHFCLRDQKKVGLITIDTYRIAAVEQLRTYAEIINVPLEVVMSPREYRDALDRLADCDIVLVDTAGRSQRDASKHEELLRFFDTVGPDEIHLVLSSTCSRTVLLEIVQRFSVFQVDRLIFTKLDEAVGFGVMLACLEKANARLSYVTTGQSVPEDIRVVEQNALARLIVADRNEGKQPISPTAMLTAARPEPAESCGR